MKISYYAYVIHELLEPLGFKSHILGSYDMLENFPFSVIVGDDFVVIRRVSSTNYDNHLDDLVRIDLNNPKSLDEIVKMVRNAGR